MVIELVAAAFAFVAVTTLAVVVFGGGSGSRDVERRLNLLTEPVADATLEGGGLLRSGTSRFPLLRLFLANTSWADRAARDLERAGLPLKVSEYLLVRLLFALAPALVVLLAVGGSLGGLLISIAAAAVGFMAPALWVNLRKVRRTAAIDSQLVETLQLISNALRSGFAFTQAVEMAAKQLAPPMSDELNHFLRDMGLGARTEPALKALVERTGSLDVDMMVTTILVQRTTGGNLSEILDAVTETIRERERLNREIRALTASQRLTGLILSIYPVLLLAFFFAIAPSLMKVLFTEPVGRVMLAIALVLQVAGAITIRRILRLDV